MLCFRLVADVGAIKAVSVKFAVTAVAVLVGSPLLHERLSAVQLVGAVVVVSGCSLVLGLVPRVAGHCRRCSGEPMARDVV